jgi:serine/threonine protein kinase
MIYTIFSLLVSFVSNIELTDLLDKILQKNPTDRITLQEIRAHKWMEGTDCPTIAPKISGKVDSSKLGQVVKSINSEKSYICYTFNSYEPPVNRHLVNSRTDVSRRQRSNSAMSARKKSYSIGKEGRPALESILGKDARPYPETSVGGSSVLGKDNRPFLEDSVGRNSAVGRPMAETSVYSNVRSTDSSLDNNPNAENSTSSRPNAEVSIGRQQWADSSPAESSPLKESPVEDDSPTRGVASNRGMLGFKRRSFSRKMAVPLRQEGSFQSKAVPTVPRDSILIN